MSQIPPLHSRALQRLQWRQVQALVPSQIRTLILPVGTVEAHGSACLGTDNYIPESISLAIAEGLHALVAPTVNHGITRSLIRYPGGTTVSPETFSGYVSEVIESAAMSGFKEFFIMNGHGGNNSALKQLALDLHREHGLCIAVIHWWELVEKVTEQHFGHAGGHAGTDETAMVLALDPSLADEKSYSPDLAYTFVPGADIYPVPGTVLLYKEGEGYPEFDLIKAKEYQAKVFGAVRDFCLMIQSRWRAAGLS